MSRWPSRSAVPEHIRILERRLRQELDRVERLLEGLLSLARSQHAPVGEELTVALDQIATEAVARRAPEISAKQLDVDLEPGHRTLGYGQRDVALANGRERDRERDLPQPSQAAGSTITPAADGALASLVVENGGSRLDPRRCRSARRTVPTARARPRTGSQTGTGLGLSIVAVDRSRHTAERSTSTPAVTAGSES